MTAPARRAPTPSAIGKLLAPLGTYLRAHRSGTVAMFTLVVASQAAMLLSVIPVRAAIDDALPARDVEALVRAVVLCLILRVSSHGMTLVSALLGARVSVGVGAAVQRDMFAALVRAPLADVEKQAPADWASRFIKDAVAVRAIIADSLPSMLADTAMLLTTSALLLLLDWMSGLIALAFTAMTMIVDRFLRRSAARASGSLQKNTSEIAAFVDEHVRMLPILQIYGREAWASERFQSLLDERARTRVRLGALERRQSNWAQLGDGFLLALLLVVGAWRLENGFISLGTLVVALEYSRQYAAPVLRFRQRLLALGVVGVAIERANRLRLTPGEPDLERPTFVPKIRITRKAEPLSEFRPSLAPAGRGVIEFEDVWFGYDPTSPVVRGVSFRIPAGSRCALVGPTGHGKSTLLALLLRFYHPQRGRILLDGNDIRTLPLPELRSQLGLLPQEPRLVPGTLMQNVLLGQVIDNPKEAATKALAEVGALEILERLPGGLETQAETAAELLSPGERQLVICARAIARNPHVLLLDEATASIDPQAEQRIHTAIERVCARRTTVIVAHRLATVASASNIVVIEHGCVAESGSRATLLAKNGRYAALERAGGAIVGT